MLIEGKYGALLALTPASADATPAWAPLMLGPWAARCATRALSTGVSSCARVSEGSAVTRYGVATSRVSDAVATWIPDWSESDLVDAPAMTLATDTFICSTAC